jgi:hypothetical protein
MRLDVFTHQDLQQAQQVEPTHECVFRDGRPAFASADAGYPALGRVISAEPDLDANVNAVSLHMAIGEVIPRTRDLRLRFGLRRIARSRDVSGSR